MDKHLPMSQKPPRYTLYVHLIILARLYLFHLYGDRQLTLVLLKGHVVKYQLKISPLWFKQIPWVKTSTNVPLEAFYSSVNEKKKKKANEIVFYGINI